MDFLKFSLLVSVVFLLLACSDDGMNKATQIRLAMLPDQDILVQQKRFAPLLRYLQQETGLEVSLIITKDYANLLELFARKEIDLARFGGFTYVKARYLHQADPLVMRDVDLRFTSYFVTRADDDKESFQDYQKARFAFGPELSTSGHLMPRFFMRKDNVIPETYFSQVLYSQAHDQTIDWVVEGKADIGVVNSVVVDNLLARNGPAKQKLRILSQTPPYADYVWAAQPDLPASTKSSLTAAFIRLSSDNTEQRLILESVNAGYYLPASNINFTRLESIAHDLINATE